MINKKTMIIMTRSSMMQHSQMALWHGSRAKGPKLCWILALLTGCTFIIIIMIDIVIVIGNSIINYIISYYCFYYY